MTTLLVTGASRGLGRYIAEHAAAAGWTVVGLARTPADLAGVDMRVCDIGDADQVAQVFKTLRKSGLFAVVNAAGIASMNLVLTTPPETVERIVRTNLIGTINVCREAGRLLARGRCGRILNFSTIAVPLALKGEAVYVASKAGVEGFSRAFAREMADHNVTVNVIAPGPIDTDLIAKIPPEKIERIVDRQIIPRRGTPDDVWHVVQMLLDPNANFVTGQVINLGGA